MSTPPEHQFKLRLPAELKERLEKAAREAGRSLSAEIVHRLQESLLPPLPLAGTARQEFNKFLDDVWADREFYADLGEALARHLREIAADRKKAAEKLDSVIRETRLGHR